MNNVNKNDKYSQETISQHEVRQNIEAGKVRRLLYPRAALVGFFSGLVVLLFRACLTVVSGYRRQFLSWSGSIPGYGWIFPVLMTATGAVIAVWMTRRFAPEAAGSGIPHLKAVLHHYTEIVWKRLLAVKFIGGLIALGSGLALGREGPSVQIGGTVAEAVAKRLKVSDHEKDTLISAGSGAGLAAAFNTPLSGFLFVLEEVQKDFKPVVFGAAFVAATVGNIVSRIGSGQFPIFNVPSYEIQHLNTLPFFAILGIFAGLLGIVFNRSLLITLKAFAHIPSRYILLGAAIIGGGIGYVGWHYPSIVGGGHNLTETALKGEIILAVIPIFFLMRLLMTTSSYATGAPGGIFMPLLTLGSLLGLFVGIIGNRYAPDFVPVPAVFAVVGMGAYFTAIVRAPLTGIVLIVEMTGNYSLMLPLLVSCFCAYAIAEILKDKPIYDALYENLLSDNGGFRKLKRPVVVTYELKPGAPFAGLEVRALGLPQGCLVIRYIRDGQERVPKATTKLEVGMEITALVMPESAHAIELLQNGCGWHQNGES